MIEPHRNQPHNPFTISGPSGTAIPLNKAVEGAKSKLDFICTPKGLFDCTLRVLVFISFFSEKHGSIGPQAEIRMRAAL